MYLPRPWDISGQLRMIRFGCLLIGKLAMKAIHFLFFKLASPYLKGTILLGGLILVLVISSALLGLLNAILNLLLLGAIILLLRIGLLRIRISCLRREAKILFEKARSTYSDGTFTSWRQWPVEDSTRKAVEAARKNNPEEEIIIGRIDNDGRITGPFGDLPGWSNISEADFEKKHRYLLEIVLAGDNLLVRKDFRGRRFSFVHEWHNLSILYGKANIPAIYRVDENRCRLYKNLIPGRTVRDGLVYAGAKILTVQTKDDPELTKLDANSRIEAVWARGRAHLHSCFPGRFIFELENQLDRIHACGITGVSLTFGNVIADSKNSTPWLIDFDRARTHCSTSSPIFAFRRNQDRIKFNKIYGGHLITEESARQALAKNASGKSGWYAPVDFGGGLTVGAFWSIDSGTGRWEFFNKEIMMPLVAGKRVLDLGSNNGAMSMMMLRCGAREVVGIEVSPVFAERARLIHKIFEWRDIRKYAYKIYNCDMLKILQTGWGRFDLVTALASLYYLPPEDMSRIVRKVSEISPIMILQVKTDTRPEAAEDKARKSSVGFLKEMLENNGFPKVKVISPAGYNRPLLAGRKNP